MKTRFLTILASFFAVVYGLEAQTYSRINDLPVRNTPAATDSIPASDAAGVNWRIPYSKFGAGGTGGIPTTSDVLMGNGSGGAAPLGSGTGVKLMLQTPTSANLKSAITDDLGVSGGKLIFAQGQLNISTGKILTANNTITIVGTDAATLNIGAGGTIATVAYTGSFSDLSGTASIVKTSNSNTYGAGKVQLFSSDATEAGIGFNSVSVDPSAVVEGRVWYRGNTHRLMFNNGTTNLALATTAEAGGAASEATVFDANSTWPNGVTTLRQATAALTANRTTNLPAASSYPAGTSILYVDQVSTPTSAFGRAFTPSGSDTLFGSPFTPFLGNGNARFETDGVSKWTPLDTRAVITALQDPNDPTKQGNFDVSGLATGTIATITVAGTGPIPLPTTGATGQFVKGLDAIGNLIYGTPAGSGDALTTQPLSQFAATTSSQFLGVISDENAPDGPTAKVLAANGGISIATGKTVTVNSSLTLGGVDGAALNVLGAGGTIPVGSAGYQAASTFAQASTIRTKITWLTTAGSGTFTVTTGAKALYVEMVGAGGGGGGAVASASNSAAGGGGGGGGFAGVYITTPAATYSYTVGAGGIAGVAAGTGTGGTGGTTTFGSVASAAGGAGGTGDPGTTTYPRFILSGAGGTATLGDAKFAGGDGMAGNPQSTTQAISGFGGESVWGGLSRGQITPVAGNPGNPAGGGGAGGLSKTATGLAGGAGADGAIRVLESL